MATATRQPFAPLDGSRLQSLTSLKNRQNAAPSPSAGKRKAEFIDFNDDAENVDPLMFSKRVKPLKGQSSSTKDVLFKPSSFILNSKPAAKPIASPLCSTPTSNSLPSSRRTIKSPAKISSGISKACPLTAPAGRSPTRGKRSGLLSNRRRTAGSYSRIDPPSFRSSGGAAPFSLDAALKGTIPSYASRPTAPKPVSNPLEPDMKSSWFFDIHEDTEEQEMTNMLQHSTCVLDISSDEESELKARREGREDKENVPPVDDVSQTSGRRTARSAPRADDMVVEKERVALGALNTADFYAEGCDESTVIFIPADEDAETDTEDLQPTRAPKNFVFAEELNVASAENAPALDAPVQHVESIETLMTKTSEPGSSKAAVLQPIEGTGDSFELWESGSAKDDGEGATASSATI